MKIFIAGVTLLFFSTLSLSAQDHLIKGIVADTASNTLLASATITVLNSKDSTLVNFTRADKDGSFRLQGLDKGKFILLITYPRYADYVEQFNLDSTSSDHDFKSINMVLRARLLSEVIVKGTISAITIKGDTTEFNAAAYQIQPNSKVEDLLKQLPGIQVDKDGRITAQGQSVNKVLVDGEEFFGDDPTLVTRNIHGDMVDKVQLYDKKSDQAAFTGIDDGEKTKTINLKLKENKNTGYFGKADAGGGSDDFYQEQAMFNTFKDKEKFSVYGTVANTGRTGLALQDNRKYGTMGINFTDENLIIVPGAITDDLDAYSGRYEGEGIPQTKSAGVHYDAKWSDDKQSINTNYRIGSIHVQGIRNLLTQNNLATGIINSSSDQTFDNYLFRQKLDVTYLAKLSTVSDLKISVEGTLKSSKTANDYNTLSLMSGVKLNDSDRTLAHDGDQKILNSSILWTKKLKKAGRTISLNLRNIYNNNETEGFLNSKNSFYHIHGILDSVQLVNQYKTNLLSTTALYSNLTYTEPLSKTWSVIFNYGAGINASRADRRSFNQSASGEYNLLDPGFSNNFKLNQFYNQPGAIFNYRKNKAILNFGTKIGLVDLEQDDLNTGENYNRNFLNWSPQASYQYSFSQQRFLRFNFTGTTVQPFLEQLQAVRINNDPLNIIIGNPDLDASFVSKFNLVYNSYRVVNNQAIYLNGSYSFFSSPVVNSTVTDAFGKNTYRFINLTGEKPFSFNFVSYYTQKLKNTNIEVGMDLNANGGTYFNLVNSILNKTRFNTYSTRFTVSKVKPEKFEVFYEIGPEYNVITSLLQPQINNNGWGLNSRLRMSVYLPGRMQISSDAIYQYKGRTLSFGQDFSRLLWNTTLSRKFFKAENLQLAVTGNDLLNQNIGFTRTAVYNMINQNSFTTIRRYIMFSVIYDFSKMGASQSK